MQRRRDRLELERDLGKTRTRGRGFQLSLRPHVRVRVVIDEEGGAAEDDAAGLATHARRAGLPQEAQESRDDLRERMAPQPDLGLFLEQRRAEDALEGSHQAARIVREMSPHRLAAIGDAVILEAEEHRRRDRLPTFLQGEDMRAVAVDDRRRRIRGAEVDSAGARRPPPRRWGADCSTGCGAGARFQIHCAGAIARKRIEEDIRL
jgi:hypothetical protein